MTHNGPIRVLFVCHANMCRSPLAEALFRHHARRRGVEDRYSIESAGTWAVEGIEPHRGSVAVAERFGLDLPSLCGRSRAFVPEDLQRFDHVIVMDRSNRDDVVRTRRGSAFGPVEGPQAQVRLLRELVDGAGADDVPDPVRGGPAQFERVYHLLERGVIALLEELTPRARGS